jgi:hypothetical protein
MLELPKSKSALRLTKNFLVLQEFAGCNYAIPTRNLVTT